MRIERIDGTKVTLAVDHFIDTDRDSQKAVEASLRITIDLAEVLDEVTKGRMPDWLRGIVQRVTGQQ